MANEDVWPYPDDHTGTGKLLTFVVPAPRGCNLSCPFCFIRQRQEITEDYLQIDDFLRFLCEAAEDETVFALSIQGYEPLLPESMPYTQALLATGRQLGLATSFVTNGTFLADEVAVLETLAPDRIAISLDAASAEIHNRLRGANAFAATVEGIVRAVDVLMPRTKLVISSVLLPGKREHLDGLPALLSEFGINDWIINPLIRVGQNEDGGPVCDRDLLFQDCLMLQDAAERSGIRLTLDDPHDRLDHRNAIPLKPKLRTLRVRNHPSDVEIFRFTPSGHCSVGMDIIRRMNVKTPRWMPGETHAGAFLEAISAKEPVRKNELRSDNRAELAPLFVSGMSV